MQGLPAVIHLPSAFDTFLLLLCLGAFGMSLWCLLFMAPLTRLKRFMATIDSLGGGMKGIEAHVDGVRDEIKTRLAELEEKARRQVEEARQAATAGLDKLARENRELQREMERLRKDVQSLQAELRATGADTMKVGQSCKALTKQLQQLRSDFDALDVELRESVRQLVADSFSTVESTVLSALDAVQEEILYGVSASTPPSKPLPTCPEPSRPVFGGERRGRDNIIPVEPLFANLRAGAEDEETESEGEPDGPGPDDEGGASDEGPQGAG